MECNPFERWKEMRMETISIKAASKCTSFRQNSFIYNSMTHHMGVNATETRKEKLLAKFPIHIHVRNDAYAYQKSYLSISCCIENSLFAPTSPPSPPSSPRRHSTPSTVWKEPASHTVEILQHHPSKRDNVTYLSSRWQSLHTHPAWHNIHASKYDTLDYGVSATTKC